MVDHLRLRPLRIEDRRAALAAQAALATEGFDFLLGYEPDEPWADYLHRLDERRQGRRVVAGWVPSTFLAAVVDDVLVGRVSIRHELNAWLASFGGHIGYAVVAGHRRCGYATEMLRQALVVARSLGVGPVMVACDAGNVGSARVIERCGGVLDAVVDQPDRDQPLRRYWIP